MDAPDTSESAAGGAAFEAPFRHFVAHRTMLKAYVMAIVHDPDLAEDAVSDTAVEIARCWADYDPTRPFPFWARGIARRVGLALLRKRGRNTQLPNLDVLEALGSQLDEFGTESELERRKAVLRRCLDKLPQAQRRLVELRYYEGNSYDEIAKISQRSMNALYLAFSRIHAQLSDCISRGNSA